MGGALGVHLGDGGCNWSAALWVGKCTPSGNLADEGLVARRGGGGGERCGCVRASVWCTAGEEERNEGAKHSAMNYCHILVVGNFGWWTKIPVSFGRQEKQVHIPPTAKNSGVQYKKSITICEMLPLSSAYQNSPLHGGIYINQA